MKNEGTYTNSFTKNKTTYPHSFTRKTSNISKLIYIFKEKYKLIYIFIVESGQLKPYCFSWVINKVNTRLNTVFWRHIVLKNRLIIPVSP